MAISRILIKCVESKTAPGLPGAVLWNACPQILKIVIIFQLYNASFTLGFNSIRRFIAL